MRNLSNFQLFKAKKYPKMISKIVLMLIFDHIISKRYQKVQCCIILKVWPNGFCHPLRPLCNARSQPRLSAIVHKNDLSTKNFLSFSERDFKPCFCLIIYSKTTLKGCQLLNQSAVSVYFLVFLKAEKFPFSGTQLDGACA